MASAGPVFTFSVLLLLQLQNSIGRITYIGLLLQYNRGSLDHDHLKKEASTFPLNINLSAKSLTSSYVLWQSIDPEPLEILIFQDMLFFFEEGSRYLC